MKKFLIITVIIVTLYVSLLKIQGLNSEILFNADTTYIIASISTLLIVLAIRSLKYDILLRGNNIRVTKEIFLITIFGFFSNFISPIRVSEITRSYVIKRKTGQNFLKILSSSMIDSIVDIMALITVIVLFSGTTLIVFNYEYKLLLIIASISMAVLCIYFLGTKKGEKVANVIIGIFSKRILKNRKIDIISFIDNSKRLILNRKLIFTTYLIGIFIWILEGLKLYFLALAFGININLGLSIFIISLAYMIGGALINPSGIMQETMLLLLLLQLPFQRDALVSIGSMDAIITVGSILLIGSSYVLYFGVSEIKTEIKNAIRS